VTQFEILDEIHEAIKMAISVNKLYVSKFLLDAYIAHGKELLRKEKNATSN